MTANLQAPKLTVKQRAKLQGVSERVIYMAQELLRLSPELGDEVHAGRLKLHAALRIAKGMPKQPTSWDRLVRAWNNATDNDRKRLLMQVLGE